MNNLKSDQLQNKISLFFQNKSNNDLIEITKYVIHKHIDPNSDANDIINNFIDEFIGINVWRNIVIDARRPLEIIKKTTIPERNLVRMVQFGLMVESFNRFNFLVNKIY